MYIKTCKAKKHANDMNNTALTNIDIWMRKAVCGGDL